jgi:hypothetical protein
MWVCSKTPGPPMSINKKVHNMYSRIIECLRSCSSIPVWSFCSDPYPYGYLAAPKNKTVWLVVLTILKNMKVNGKDDIPDIMENKIHVPNHQPVFDSERHVKL